MLVLRLVLSHMPRHDVGVTICLLGYETALVRRSQDARQDLDQQCDHLHVCCSRVPTVDVGPNDSEQVALWCSLQLPAHTEFRGNHTSAFQNTHTYAPTVFLLYLSSILNFIPLLSVLLWNMMAVSTWVSMLVVKTIQTLFLWGCWGVGVRCANNRQRLLAQPSLILQPGV